LPAPAGALALTTGAAALLAGALRLGFLASFISEPVIKGFIVGLALTIIVGQVPTLLGVGKGDGDFFEKLWDLMGRLGEVDGPTLVVGGLSLAAVLALRRVAPAVPGSLVVVLAGIAAAAALSLEARGVDLVGTIEPGLPPLGVPDVGLQDLGSLVPGGIGIMLVGFAEGLGAAKTYAARDHYDIDANRELLGLGAANTASGLASGMVVNGSHSKTAINGSAGARTQLSGLIVAVLTILTLLLLTRAPRAAAGGDLAAVVIAAVVELVDVGALARLYRVVTRRASRLAVAARPDFAAAIAALLGVLVFDTLPGLFIGIGVSFLLLLYRASRPHVAVLGEVPEAPEQYGDVARHPENRTRPDVVVVRVDAGLFFANADWVRARIIGLAGEGVRAVVLDAETVPFIDVTAADMLGGLVGDLDRRGVELLIARDVGPVRDVLRRSGGAAVQARVHPTVREAVEAAAAPGGAPQP
jgi:MFS superfamily sulfate permease-like transporter